MSTESINTFNNVGKKWSDDDIELLKNNYTNNNFSVYKLSIIHHRTMYAILCQLKKMNIINNLEEATGYNEYIEFRDKEKESLNHIKNDLFKTDYLENNLSLEDLATKYNLSNIQVLKKLAKSDILKESDKAIYEETITNKQERTEKLDAMYTDIQVLKTDIEQIKNDMKEFKNTFNKLINILTKK
jgi:hypothetical protein